MGVILTRFRKKRTTLEVLQELDDRIQDIKHRRVTAEQRKRVVVGRLMLYSAGLYVLAALWFYFRSFPSTLRDQAFHILPLCVFPIVVVVVRWAVALYFRRKIVRSELELKQKENLKRDILEEVMNKETYKSAKEILERFAPAEMKTQIAAPGPTHPGKISPSPHQGMELRRRPIAPPPAPPTSSPPKRPPSLLRSSSPPSPPPQGQPPERRLMVGGTGRGLPLPRPIYPRERSVVDKLVDFLIADGPTNRFALICKECSSHNGMALKEEFEYLTFRCCYCFAMNPARKQRPQAPKIEDKKEPAAESSSSEPDTPPTNTSEDEEDAPSKGEDGVGFDEDEHGDTALGGAEGDKSERDAPKDEKADMVGGTQ